MSRSYHQHDKSWNYPKREAKHYSNKYRRRHGKKFLNNLDKVDDNDNDLAVDVPKNAGNGDIWIYD